MENVHLSRFTPGFEVGTWLLHSSGLPIKVVHRFIAPGGAERLVLSFGRGRAWLSYPFRVETVRAGHRHALAKVAGRLGQ